MMHIITTAYHYNTQSRQDVMIDNTTAYPYVTTGRRRRQVRAAAELRGLVVDGRPGQRVDDGEPRPSRPSESVVGVGRPSRSSESVEGSTTVSRSLS